MSSEPKRQPSPQPGPASRRTEGPGTRRPDPARGGDVGAAELGYDPDDPETWPGSALDVPAGSAEGAATVMTSALADDEADDEPVTLTDAKAMRAVAHPVRMALIELFAVRPTLTATQASEALGESPANCAFHLRTLAKYGFIREAGGGRGRERPWTLVNRSVTVTTQLPDPQAALAAGELGRLWLERWIDRARRAYGSRSQVPGWDEAEGWSDRHVFLTAEETTRLRADMSRMLKCYEDRLTDPSLRPQGALPVEWTIFASPVPELAEPAEPGPAAGPDDPGAGGPDNLGSPGDVDRK
jgi:predicted transcriptional regulator